MIGILVHGDNHFIVRTAMAGAVFTMAFQVSGKAARDALFLSNFGPEQLPAMIMAGGVTSILLGLVNAKILARYTPRQVVPWLMIASGILQALEWWVYGGAPRWTAVAVYIHVVSLGAVITSGFWSVINEQLDPRTAKRNFGRVAAAGTAGGVAGGFAAERIAALATSDVV